MRRMEEKNIETLALVDDSLKIMSMMERRNCKDPHGNDVETSS